MAITVLKDQQIDSARAALYWVGRVLLGLYFIIPGISKITGWEAMTTYMEQHGVPLIQVLLVITIIVQIGGGVSLAFGYRARLMALILAGLTLVISLYMHDFWTLEEGMQRAHETQNFVKNMAIMAGLMFVAGAPLRSASNSPPD